ncbi:MAG: hypothetical protein WAK17_04345 [Candidatus Nitrosopolaris sp.]
MTWILPTHHPCQRLLPSYNKKKYDDNNNIHLAGGQVTSFISSVA